MKKICRDCEKVFEDKSKYPKESVLSICDDCYNEQLKKEEQAGIIRAKRNKLIDEQVQCFQNLHQAIEEIEYWTEAHKKTLDELAELNHLISLSDSSLKFELEKREEEQRVSESIGKPIDLSDDDLPF